MVLSKCLVTGDFYITVTQNYVIVGRYVPSPGPPIVRLCWGEGPSTDKTSVARWIGKGVITNSYFPHVSVLLGAFFYGSNLMTQFQMQWGLGQNAVYKQSKPRRWFVLSGAGGGHIQSVIGTQKKTPQTLVPLIEGLWCLATIGAQSLFRCVCVCLAAVA